MHGVLGHDGLDPADLRARGRTELGRYGVEVVTAEVQDAEALAGTVRVTSSFGADLTRTVLLATGILDEAPDIPGFAEVWGTTAHTCRTATATSTATNGSPSSPPAPATSGSPSSPPAPAANISPSRAQGVESRGLGLGADELAGVSSGVAMDVTPREWPPLAWRSSAPGDRGVGFARHRCTFLRCRAKRTPAVARLTGADPLRRLPSMRACCLKPTKRSLGMTSCARKQSPISRAS